MSISSSYNKSLKNILSFTSLSLALAGAPDTSAHNTNIDCSPLDTCNIFTKKQLQEQIKAERLNQAYIHNRQLMAQQSTNNWISQPVKNLLLRDTDDKLSVDTNTIINKATSAPINASPEQSPTLSMKLSSRTIQRAALQFSSLFDQSIQRHHALAKIEEGSVSEIDTKKSLALFDGLFMALENDPEIISTPILGEIVHIVNQGFQLFNKIETKKGLDYLSPIFSAETSEWIFDLRNTFGATSIDTALHYQAQIPGDKDFIRRSWNQKKFHLRFKTGVGSIDDGEIFVKTQIYGPKQLGFMRLDLGLSSETLSKNKQPSGFFRVVIPFMAQQ
jgi:hypothetical protein